MLGLPHQSILMFALLMILERHEHGCSQRAYRYCGERHSCVS